MTDAFTVTWPAGTLVARIGHAVFALLPGAICVYDFVPQNEVCAMVSGTVVSSRLVTARVTLPEIQRVDAVEVTPSAGTASMTVPVCAVEVTGNHPGLVADPGTGTGTGTGTTVLRSAALRTYVYEGECDGCREDAWPCERGHRCS
ncbi:hypothetical protein [Clavibacter michiganensis]|uniref:hypothetical protein n=1 Tax=Clavibacter michiganensis TaxID=28447 RepID=UPI0011B04E56|nr:hypothetical protein [Clavibacter michiganensis]